MDKKEKELRLTEQYNKRFNCREKLEEINEEIRRLKRTKTDR